jgi:hypothetical protein
MTLNINSAKTSKPRTDKVNPVPMDGVQLGVIIQVVDLGVQPGGSYQGEPKPDSRQLRVTYELPHDTHDFDGETKPLLISETFPFSGSDMSKCYKRINSIDPGLKKTNGDYAALVGEPVMVQIVHKEGKGKHEGRTFANVASVSPLMRGMTGPDSTFNPKYFYSPSSHDQEVWDQMPEFLQGIINGRLDATSAPVSARKPASNPTPQGAAPQANEAAPDEDSAW